MGSPSAVECAIRDPMDCHGPSTFPITQTVHSSQAHLPITGRPANPRSLHPTAGVILNEPGDHMATRPYRGYSVVELYAGTARSADAFRRCRRARVDLMVD